MKKDTKHDELIQRIEALTREVEELRRELRERPQPFVPVNPTPYVPYTEPYRPPFPWTVTNRPTTSASWEWWNRSSMACADQ